MQRSGTPGWQQFLSSARCRTPMLTLSLILSLFLTATAAQAAVERINLGLYGGQVADIEALDDGSGNTDLLIAVDSSQKGIFKWDGSRWRSTTYPSATTTGAFSGTATQVEVNPRFSSNVYAVISSGSVNKGLWVSANRGDLSSGAVSWQAALDSGSSQLTEIQQLVGHSSGIYASDNQGKIWQNGGSATGPFVTVFTAPGGEQIISFAVHAPFRGHVLTRDGSNNLRLYLTDFAGSDLLLSLPTQAPVQQRSGSCPISSCAVDLRLVASDPADPSGNTLYVAGSSVNAMIFKSTNGGTSWNQGWDYQCSLPANGCTGFAFMDGFPSVIRFKGTASGGNESRYIFVSTSQLDNDAGTPTWLRVANLSSTISPSGPSGPTVINFTTHANDPSLAIDPNNPDTLFIATDLAIGEISHSAWAGPGSVGSEKGNALGIEGVVINDMDFYAHSATNKDLWIATKSGLGKALNFNPSDPASTATAGDWVYPIFPLDDGAPPTAVAINPSNNAEVLAGNGKIYRNTQADQLPQAATTWSRTFDPANFDGVGEPLESARSERTSTTAIEYQQGGSCSRVYMTAANNDTGSEGGVFYSDDSGASWTIDDLNPSTLLKMPVNALWVSDTTVWVGVGDRTGASRSSETGIRARLSLCGSQSFWKPSSSDAAFTDLQTEVVTAIDGVKISGSYSVYITTLNNVYKGELPSGSSGGFSSWSWSKVTPTASGASQFNSVAVDVTDANHVWVSYGNCIRESSDGGSSWSAYGSSCQPDHEQVRKLVFDDLLSGTDQGLFAFTTVGGGEGNNVIIGSEDSSGGCFIATAAFGSYQQASVQRLRLFRDQALLPYGWGQWLVDSYYHLSPPLAGWIATNDSARAVVRVMLLPLIGLAEMVLAIGWLSSLALLLLLTIGLRYAIRRIRLQPA